MEGRNSTYRKTRRLRWSALSSGVYVGLGLAALALLVLLARASLPEQPAGAAVIWSPHEVSAVAIQGDSVWAGGAEGLVVVNRYTSEVEAPPGERRTFRYVKDILVDRGNRVWVAHEAGVSRYADGEWKHLSAADGLLAGPALALWEDTAGALWVGSTLGVVRWSGDSWVTYTTRDGLAASQVDVIFQDWDGVMWFGSSAPTQGGLTSFDGRVWRTYYVSDGLAHNSINAIMQDRDGALWFGTGFHDRGGASRLSVGVWSSLSPKDGLAGDKVRSLFEDRQGRLWFGSEYHGVAVYDGSKWRILTTDDGLASWEVKEIVQDADGAFWLATLEGLNRLASVE